MLQASLIHPVAKLDIKDLLEPRPSSPSQPRQPSQVSRSFSIPSSYSDYNVMSSPSSASTLSHHSTSTQQQRQRMRQLSARPSSHLDGGQESLNHEVQSGSAPGKPVVAGNKRPRAPDDSPADPPVKRQTKWTPAENAKIIKLREKGTKWADCSKELPNRSEISCRLHFQNYLERRGDWNEEQRDKLARVYERLKKEIWNPVASELGVPWRAAESMHWSIGEQEMARRANVPVFSMNTNNRSEESTKPGSGRIAQRDRMMESTRIFEGQNLAHLTQPFVAPPPVNGSHNHSHSNGGHAFAVQGNLPYAGTMPTTPYVHIAPIKKEQDPSSYDQEYHGGGNEGDDEVGERKVKKEGGTRLPGFSELEGEMQALAEGRQVQSTADGRVVVKGEGEEEGQGQGRRGSGGSWGSRGSRGSCGSQ